VVEIFLVRTVYRFFRNFQGSRRSFPHHRSKSHTVLCFIISKATLSPHDAVFVLLQDCLGMGQGMMTINVRIGTLGSD